MNVTIAQNLDEDGHLTLVADEEHEREVEHVVVTFCDNHPPRVSAEFEGVSLRSGCIQGLDIHVERDGETLLSIESLFGRIVAVDTLEAQSIAPASMVVKMADGAVPTIGPTYDDQRPVTRSYN